ncbi:hypothetical protein MAR_033121 [Mya arenaria]|uniref:Uncharacterized protein n=1 Tax=Mya arenaria TaxID=6604 RepID=A0ABY7GB43_MYAAR|nr:hypothetical protein MAR_033121 [Mya arenaria]
MPERDANAFYESSEVKKMTNEELISRMRKENKQKRIELARCICGDETVIHSAFHHRKEELLSMQRFTPERDLHTMEREMYQAKRARDQQLNEMKKEVDKRKEVHDRSDKRLHEYLEAKIPPDNIRIRIDTADDSDEDDFHFDHDQENDGFTSREDIKRQGQDILNSKLKPKKKKARKRNN